MEWSWFRPWSTPLWVPCAVKELRKLSRREFKCDPRTFFFFFFLFSFSFSKSQARTIARYGGIIIRAKRSAPFFPSCLTFYALHQCEYFLPRLARVLGPRIAYSLKAVN